MKHRRAWACLTIGLTLAACFLWSRFAGERRPEIQATVLANETVQVEGQTRKYRLAIPNAVDPSRPTPLLFVFHGTGDEVGPTAAYMRLDEIASREGFYVVYPVGRFANWAVMTTEERPDYPREDLVFFDVLLAELASQYNIDETRVYATGMSTGATFATLLAGRRSEKLAAVAAHSGWLPDPLLDGIDAERKCPLFVISGTEDVQVWPEMGEKVRDRFQGEGHEVEFWSIEGLPHRWAGDYEAHERIWKFLAKHTLETD